MFLALKRLQAKAVGTSDKQKKERESSYGNRDEERLGCKWRYYRRRERFGAGDYLSCEKKEGQGEI